MAVGTMHGAAGLPAPGTVAAGSPSWAAAIPEAMRRHLRIWLWAGAALTMLMLVVGGITRLTQSGLSIVDWDPIVGAVPPLTHDQWLEAFARYQQYPEYLKLRPDMTLAEFKHIFFWEYLHRLIGRTIGVVFAIPFVFFWLKGYFTRPLLKRVLVLAALGGAQGLMGWLMVRSGLVDRPSVSHYRLAAHLVLAFAIAGCCVWFASDLAGRTPLALDAATRRSIVVGLRLLGFLAAVQIVWGAFVAGLDAGVILNTFPFMNGSLLPPNGWHLDPVLRNLVDNPVTVQWTHRLLGTTLLTGELIFFARVRRATADPAVRRFNAVWCGLIMLQFVLGVSTLLSHVKTPIAASHQANAMAIFIAWLLWMHRLHVRAPEPAAAPAREPAPIAAIRHVPA